MNKNKEDTTMRAEPNTTTIDIKVIPFGKGVVAEDRGSIKVIWIMHKTKETAIQIKETNIIKLKFTKDKKN